MKTQITSIITASLLLFGGNDAKAQNDPKKPDNPANKKAQKLPAELLEDLGETEWMGMYMGNIKVGHMEATFKKEKLNGRDIYVMKGKGQLIMKIHGQENKSSFNGSKRFEANPPYALISSSSEAVTQQGKQKDVEKTIITRKNGMYHAKIFKYGKEKVVGPKRLEYGLLNVFAESVWLLKEKPKKGQVFEYLDLDEETLELKKNKVTFQGIQSLQHLGKRIQAFVVRGDEDGDSPTFTIYDKNMDMICMRMPGTELRLEPKEMALDMAKAGDFGLIGFAESNAKFDYPESVRKMVVEVDEKTATLFGNGPGQTCKKNGNGKATITIDPIHGPKIPLKKGDHEKYLKQEDDDRELNARLKKLADFAIGNAKEDQEKVNRLITFVHGFIEDDDVYEADSVLGILETKRGDCSTYSSLFAALARVSGIPCREVGGYVYGEEQQLGEIKKGFWAHAWNEVALGGVWVSVDASWDERIINATHIREKSIDDLDQKKDLDVNELHKSGAPVQGLKFKVQNHVGGKVPGSLEEPLRKETNVFTLKIKANLGNAEAQLALGELYYNGEQVEMDDKEAVAWFLKAAAKGHVGAMERLGHAYRYGYGVKKDGKEAYRWYLKAALKGNAEAQNYVAVLLDAGEGVAQDKKTAADWLRKSARQGHAWGQRNLGRAYLLGLGVQKNEAEAIKWLTKSAAQGNAYAQWLLGQMNLQGLGVIKDVEEGLEWMRQAAANGDDDAQFELGEIYDEGKLVPENNDIAFHLFRQAAEQKHPIARHNVGFMYVFGEGIKADPDKGIELLEGVAKDGHTHSMRVLGLLYRDGAVIKKDLIKSYYWLNRASSLNNTADKERSLLVNQLSPKELHEAITALKNANLDEDDLDNCLKIAANDVKSLKTNEGTKQNN